MRKMEVNSFLLPPSSFLFTFPLRLKGKKKEKMRSFCPVLHCFFFLKNLRREEEEKTLVSFFFGMRKGGRNTNFLFSLIFILEKIARNCDAILIKLMAHVIIKLKYKYLLLHRGHENGYFIQQTLEIID